MVRDVAGLSMGTSWSAKVVLEAPVANLHACLQAELDKVVGQMSHWEATSDLGRFNRAPAGSNAAHAGRTHRSIGVAAGTPVRTRDISVIAWATSWRSGADWVTASLRRDAAASIAAGAQAKPSHVSTPAPIHHRPAGSLGVTVIGW